MLDRYAKIKILNIAILEPVTFFKSVHIIGIGIFILVITYFGIAISKSFNQDI